MLLRSKLGLIAALASALTLALPTLAADPPHGHGHPHGSSYRMPPRGFHSAPPGFRGALPHVGRAYPGRVIRHGGGFPSRHFGYFRGHDFRHFTPGDLHSWRRGEWRHVWHDGHLAWWWYVDGLWFFYPAPIYPYPGYIGSTYYYDYYGEYGTPAYYWYYCEDPPGYYPYIQQCNGPWEPVPPTPSGD